MGGTLTRTMDSVAVCGAIAVVLLTVLALFSKQIKALFLQVPVALDRNKYTEFVLSEREELTHDVFRFRFSLPSKQHMLGLPTGKHITLSFTDTDGKAVARTYTPVTGDDELGYVDFVIKVYFKNVHPNFPDGGKMSQHLHAMKIGESIKAIGPKGSMVYKGRGEFELKHGPKNIETRTASHVGMIAGGTGITPMLQLVRAAMKDPKDTTQWSLLFANQSEQDIMLRTELDEMAKSDKFNVWYTVDKAPEGWAYGKGFITSEMIANHLPDRSPGNMILVCGPPPMIKFACLPAFETLGLTEEMVYIEGNRSTMAVFQEYRAN